MSACAGLKRMSARKLKPTSSWVRPMDTLRAIRLPSARLKAAAPIGHRYTASLDRLQPRAKLMSSVSIVRVAA